MTTRAELLQMTPREVIESALDNGLKKARMLQGFGVKPGAVDSWFRGRPEYNDPKVKSLMQIGDREGAREEIEKITAMLRSLKQHGPVGVMGFSDDDRSSLIFLDPKGKVKK